MTAGLRDPMPGTVAAAVAIPPSPHPDILLSRPSAGVLRVRFRGWVADVHNATVVVPQQVYAKSADPADFTTCVSVAASFAAGAPPRRKAPQDAGSAAAAESLARAAVAALRTAATVAEQHWNPRRCDIYACLSRAWADHGQVAAYAGLTAALRPLVPQGNLLAYNDTQTTGADIAALFRRAAAMVERRTADRGTARGAA